MIFASLRMVFFHPNRLSVNRSGAPRHTLSKGPCRNCLECGSTFVLFNEIGNSLYTEDSE